MAYGEQDTIGQWSLDKLDFLRKYLPAYAMATKRARQRYYIDAFAGNGVWKTKKTRDVVEGSAAIALRSAEQFTKMFFIEADADRVQNLEGLVKLYNAEHKVTLFSGDCNDILPKIISRIHPDAPTFIFLDPSKDQLNWSTIEAVASWRTELFILLPLNMTIIRYLPKHGRLDKWAYRRLDLFFGTREWEDIFRNTNRPELVLALRDFYAKRLLNLGYEHINISRVFKNDTGQKLYYMIWIGKRKVGQKIMSSVFAQQPGQLELF